MHLYLKMELVELLHFELHLDLMYLYLTYIPRYLNHKLYNQMDLMMERDLVTVMVKGLVRGLGMVMVRNHQMEMVMGLGMVMGLERD